MTNGSYGVKIKGSRITYVATGNKPVGEGCNNICDCRAQKKEKRGWNLWQLSATFKVKDTTSGFPPFSNILSGWHDHWMLTLYIHVLHVNKGRDLLKNPKDITAVGVFLNLSCHTSKQSCLCDAFSQLNVQSTYCFWMWTKLWDFFRECQHKFIIL